MMRPALPRHVLGVFALKAVRSAATTNLPYNPTQIVLSEQTKDGDDTNAYAYIIQPNIDGQASLLSLDLTQPQNASNLTLTTLYDSLPFLETNSNRAFTRLQGSEQNITVVAGDCTSSSTAPEVWTFIPAAKGKDGNGTWSQSTPATDTSSTIQGPDFLSSGIAFSELAKGNASTTSLYVFGGMCPLANSTSDTWMSAANYTNQMITFSPELDSSKQVAYTPAFLSSKGPPVAEAGFSMTPLSPSYSDNSSSTQSAQQSFVLVGGHTGAAFINMSSVALFSLPEETWTYIDVDQPSTANTDLAARSTATEVEPRSGHTAVLAEDGKSVIVFGGWVGDVTNAASPQLAVLELGSGYGGDGDWTWTIPSQSGTATLSGAGVYGHGAAMLPGNVMMIIGGYSIPTTSSKRLLRRASSPSNSQTLFFNVTSKSWISSYDGSASIASTVLAGENQRKGALTTTSQKAGLGAGLSIGAIVVAVLIVFYFWYKRHLKRRREAREGDRERLYRSGGNNFEHAWFGTQSGYEQHQAEYGSGGIWDDKMNEPADGYAYAPYGVDDSLPINHTSNRDVERTGLSVNVPSPTRGLRKGGLTRSQYQYHAAPRYDETRISRTSGNIHPIEERDEEEERLSSRHSNKRDLDPFRDPLPNPLRSHPVTPELGSPIHRAPTNASHTTNGTDAVTSWIKDWTNSYAATLRPTSDNLMARCASPGKTDERTSSNLSENSNRSGLSMENRSVARTSSTRSALFFGLSGHPSITPSQAPTSVTSRSLSPAYWDARQRQSGTLSPGRPTLERAPDSVSTQCTTWGQLMAEGEALLGQTSNSQVAPLNVKTRPTSAELLANAGPTPPLPPRRRGWMGSIRKVFGTDRSLSASHAGMSISGPMAQIPPQQYTDRSNNNSPVRGHTRAGASVSSRAGATSAMSGPRRAASDSSEFWRIKRGRRDWEGDDSDPRWAPYRDEPDMGDWGDVPDIQVQNEEKLREHSDEDWDPEEAAVNRDVQVMFTVPKARLRVVNADVDKGSLRSVSDSANSIRARNMSLKREQEAESEKQEQPVAQRKPSNYGIQIVDWEREALEKRDREEEERRGKSE